MVKRYTIAAVAMALFLGAIGEANLSQRAEEIDFVEVLVASHDLRGDHYCIRDKGLIKASFPAAVVPANAIFSLEGYRGAGLIRPVDKGQILLDLDVELYPDLDIPEGRCAVGMAVENQNLPCDLLPGQIVDIHFDSKPATQHFEDIKNVIAVCAGCGRRDPDAKGSIATLALSEVEALRLCRARETCAIRITIPPRIDGFVASRDIEANTVLSHPYRHLRRESFRRDSTPAGAKLVFDDVRDLKVLRAIRKGEMITREDLVTSTSSLASRKVVTGVKLPADDKFNVPDGLDTVELTIHDLHRLNRTNSRADISLEHKAADGTVARKLMVSNALILACRSPKEAKDADDIKIYTVAVEPKDALRLSLARTLGTMVFSSNPWDRWIDPTSWLRK